MRSRSSSAWIFSRDHSSSFVKSTDCCVRSTICSASERGGVEGEGLTGGLLQNSGVTGQLKHIHCYLFEPFLGVRAVHAMPRAPPGLRQIDAAEQQRKFLVAENDFCFFTVGFRPAEPALLQPLGTDPESAPIPEQKLQTVALRVGEKENMPAQRIACKPVAHQPVQAFKTLAHVRRSGGKIDPCRGANPEHQACSSTATSCRNVPTSKPRFTSIRRPPGRSTDNSLPCRGCPAISTGIQRRD